MNYKRLGDYIQQINVRNTALVVDILLGVSITRKLIPSIANTIGTDMSVYKIIERQQFAYGTVTSRNGDKISIALADEHDKALVSQIYVVFEVIDKEELIPEYLMMWFSRPEFDRYARYHSHGSTRETFDWDDMCEVQLPIPTIDKQRAIVAEYQSIENKIAINNQICEKLEATAQALYRHWFVDFEFPNEEGKPYKSSGGAMVYNEEMEKEIPEGWEVGSLGEFCDFIDGDRGINYPSQQDFCAQGYCLFLNAGNVTKLGFDFNDCVFITEEKEASLRKGRLEPNDIVLTSRGTVGNVSFFSNVLKYKTIRINSGMLILRPKENPSFLYTLLKSYEFVKQIENYISGSAVPQLPIKDLNTIKTIIPNSAIMNIFSNKVVDFFRIVDLIKNETLIIQHLQSLLLSRLAKQ